MKKKKGSALLTTVCISMMMFTLSAALIIVGTSSNRLTNSYNQKSQRQLCAESGINKAVNLVMSSHATVPTLVGYTHDSTKNSISTADFNSLHPELGGIKSEIVYKAGDENGLNTADHLTVISTAKDSNNNKKTIKVVFKISPPSTFLNNKRGIVSIGGLTDHSEVYFKGVGISFNDTGAFFQGNDVTFDGSSGIFSQASDNFDILANNITFKSSESSIGLFYNIQASGKVNINAKTKLDFQNGYFNATNGGILASPMFTKSAGANISDGGAPTTSTTYYNSTTSPNYATYMSGTSAPQVYGNIDFSVFASDDTGSVKTYLDPTTGHTIKYCVIYVDPSKAPYNDEKHFLHRASDNQYVVNYRDLPIAGHFTNGDERSKDDVAKILVLPPDTLLNVTGIGNYDANFKNLIICSNGKVKFGSNVALDWHNLNRVDEHDGSSYFNTFALGSGVIISRGFTFDKADGFNSLTLGATSDDIWNFLKVKIGSLLSSGYSVEKYIED